MPLFKPAAIFYVLMGKKVLTEFFGGNKIKHHKSLIFARKFTHPHRKLWSTYQVENTRYTRVRLIIFSTSLYYSF